jgi:lipopolysaccharide export system protein LptA
MLLYDASMKSIIAMLFLTAAVATAQTGSVVNPKRFTAAKVSQTGDVTRLHGNAVVRWGTGTLFTEDIEYQHGHSDMRTQGDSRLDVVNVKPNPGFSNIPIAPKLFSADEIRQEGNLAIFHGNVRITATGAFRIEAGDATVNTVTGSITVRGDATFIILKRNGCTTELSTELWTGKVGSPCGILSDDLGPLELPR